MGSDTAAGAATADTAAGAAPTDTAAAAAPGKHVPEDAWAQPLATAPPPDDAFRSTRTVRTGDVDSRERLRLDGVARYLQDIGTDNLDAVDATDTDPLWIVRRTVVDVHRPARFREQLELRRWCDALSTRWANVRVRFEGTGGAAMDTSAFWINIGPTNGMPARISDRLWEHMARHAADTRLRWRAWLPPTPSADADAGTHFPLRATDIDPFDHVNNAAYWHGIEEHLAGRPELQTAPYRAAIEHLRPVVAGDTLVLRARHDVDSLTLWFTVDDEVRAVARVGRR
ncbi:acyl-[acyl-carrier-protein] thioesterase [Rhodococcus ruber]|uniref:acyl-[acyl-carrier-protein] thioesterase n=1 Tax=Rhodococcus ruber TaxID=1830 RepID=UPI001EEF61CA|nr:acyl-ACP thioesterase domain-containing protein [Rhodococcus ruber]MCF8781740.1 4-hydroxybenzoyl-CoA thioesterase [Rhodococcus ruber]MDO1479104.1 4-hydroxybenzoyl-CoA thioesterase [Rhodococcus ruber]